MFVLVCLDADRPFQRSSRLLLRRVSLLLAVGALSRGFLAALVLQGSSSDFTWLDMAQTNFALSGMLVAVASAVLAALAARYSAALLLPAILLMGASITISHAFACPDHLPALLSVTLLHRIATSAWIGGLPYLLLVLSRGEEDSIAPVARRFSRVAAVSTALLLGAGLLLGWQYTGNVEGVYGTSYGVMLGTKAVLFTLLLFLGSSNFFLLRRSTGFASNAWLRMRRVVECEVAIGFTEILAAASLTSQPPAIDLKDGRVSAAEIIARFTPHVPRLTTPSLAALSPATPLSAEESKRFGAPLSYVPGSSYEESSQADIEWSEFNHNWAGACVLAAGILAVLAQTKRMRWARHWPLAFLGLAVFILVRADFRELASALAAFGRVFRWRRSRNIA